LGLSVVIYKPWDTRQTPETAPDAKLDVRNNRGEMIPIGTFVSVEETFGPQVIQRYNLYPSAQINGSPAPGYSSGQALALMKQMADEKLPTSMGFQWTGMSYQEDQLKNSTQFQDNPMFILLLSVIFVFLVLAVGLAVVGGMIAATCFSLLFVPSFFVVFQSLSEFRKKPESETTSADAH